MREISTYVKEWFKEWKLTIICLEQRLFENHFLVVEKESQ